ncbi:MAG: S41 family peptidase [Chloroflexi bacterium]|nr:S41 family peptidase [Chloroflexota bacterium]
MPAPTGSPHRWNALFDIARSAASLVLVLVAFLLGAIAERQGALPGSIARQPDALTSTFGIFWEAWDHVQQDYVDKAALDPRKMTYGAIGGMLDSLGDIGHTRFMTPDELKAEQEALSGQLEGIGAELVIRDLQPTILAPLPDSPAEQAGLRAGDTIVRVNGTDVAGASLERVVQLVRGPAGTPVTLTVIHRDESNLQDITIIRQRLTVPAVSWAWLPGTSVADVAISQFSEHCTDQLIAALQAARSGGATALILDLRNDPGGIRDEAIGVASQFLKDGLVLIEQDSNGNRTTFPVRGGGIATDLPLVVLVNEGSASSAEIVAGAIQDHGRGQLVGTTTFGTGTVLSSYQLSDGSAILLGTEEWLTPNGSQIWHHGIKPDVTVTLPTSAVSLTPRAVAQLTPAQLQASTDQQLVRALQEAQQNQPTPSSG